MIMMAVMAVLWCSSWAAYSQELKIGYVNTDSVFTTLPETQVQQKQLESYSKQLQARLQQKQQLMQQKYQEAVQKVQQGGVTPEQQQALEKELQGMQADLQKEQAAAQVNLSKKESELLKPLYDKIRVGIEAVAKEQGFTYVLSYNVLMYGAEVHDITNLVITSLNK